MKLLSVILVVILIPLGFVQGQMPDSHGTPIWGNDLTQETILPRSVFWAIDGQTLYFSVLITDQADKQYHVDTETLENRNGIPQTIRLSPDQERHFHAQVSLGYIAPDQDAFIYIGTSQSYSPAEGGYTPFLYSIGNIKEQTFFPTRIPVFEGATFRWSDESSAFVMQYGTPYGGQEGFYYIKSTGSACPQHFCTFAEVHWMVLNTGDTIYDLSPNGERILYKDYQGVFRLWDVKRDAGFGEITSPGDALPVENVVGAAFLPDMRNIILVVNSQGIVRYDLDTKESVVVDTSISSMWAKWVMFSPDNQHAAVLAGDSDSFGWKQLFVLSVSQDI
jgi:WD40 repeat protein